MIIRRFLLILIVSIPLMAGPGAITACVLLAGRTAGDPATIAALLAVMVVVIGMCLALFLVAGRIGKLIGVTGNIVISRLLGVILAALAVQFVVDGVKAVWS